MRSPLVICCVYRNAGLFCKVSSLKGCDRYSYPFHFNVIERDVNGFQSDIPICYSYLILQN